MRWAAAERGSQTCFLLPWAPFPGLPPNSSIPRCLPSSLTWEPWDVCAWERGGGVCAWLGGGPVPSGSQPVCWEIGRCLSRQPPRGGRDGTEEVRKPFWKARAPSRVTSRASEPVGPAPLRPALPGPRLCWSPTVHQAVSSMPELARSSLTTPFGVGALILSFN